MIIIIIFASLKYLNSLAAKIHLDIKKICKRTIVVFI